MAEIKDKFGVRALSWRDMNFELLGMLKTIIPSVSELVDKLHAAQYDGSEDYAIKALNYLGLIRDAMTAGLKHDQRDIVQTLKSRPNTYFLTEDECAELREDETSSC